ncbi:MAG TPA: holdfast anchor protein HfaD [Caulobacteraceae bacterium]|jgi:hypothetical protein
MLWSGTAISQSTVDNNQVQVGDVFATGELDVVTNTSDTVQATTGTGNSLIGSAVSGSIDVESTQTMQGNVAATTTVNVDNDAGPELSSTTAATGNAGDSVITGGGALTGNFIQNTTGASVDAESQANGANAQMFDGTVETQAIANGQTLGASGSDVDVAVNQTNTASAVSNGGVIFGDVTDQAAFISSGAGNDLTSVGQGSSQGVTATQDNEAQLTQGTMFVNLGNSEITDTSATATGNDINITNADGSLNVIDDQTNNSFVNAQAVETSYQYGGATVNADAVGNAAFAGNQGPVTSINNTQLNGSFGVESQATFNSAGSPGYDAFVSSTATGNSVTGFACSLCGGVINATNSQTNQGDVSAFSQIGVANGRSVRGTANAAGNTASFYVSSPSN